MSEPQAVDRQFWVKYVPTQTAAVTEKDGSVSPATVKGHVVIDAPDYVERMEYLDEAGFKVKDGKVDFDPNDTKGLRSMVKIARAKVKEVDIEVIESGVKHVSWASMERDPDCSDVVLEVSLKLLNGFKPSKN